MNEPIKSGDLCEVIAGALGHTGPNIGKRVTVGQLFAVITACTAGSGDATAKAW